MTTLRTPPHNIEAEKALLGSIFADNRTFEKVSGFLRAEHFAVVPHGRIFEAAAALIERGQVADPVTLKRYFEQDETMAEIGGLAEDRIEAIQPREEDDGVAARPGDRDGVELQVAEALDDGGGRGSGTSLATGRALRKPRPLRLEKTGPCQCEPAGFADAQGLHSRQVLPKSSV